MEGRTLIEVATLIAVVRLEHDAYAIQGGRAKRVYRLTHIGSTMLQEERRQWTWLWNTLPRGFERGL